MYGIDAVWHILCLGKAVLIADKRVTLVFLRRIEAACGFQIYFKDSPLLWRFNLGFAVVGVLDDGDVPLDDLLVYVVLGRIIFHGVKLWLCAYMVDCGIQKIALGRCNLTDAPIVAADIIFCCELPVFIGGIGVNQFLALIDAVNRTCKGGVALRLLPRFHVGL